MQTSYGVEYQAGESAMGLVVGCGTFIIVYAILIIVCYLLYNIQKAIPAEHRKIEPGMVWLLLIPIFNLVWNFFVFLRVPESYQSYFRSIGRTDVGDAGRQLGLWYAICAVLSLIPCLGIFAGIAALVLLILLLVKLTGLRREVEAAGGGTVPPAAGPL